MTPEMWSIVALLVFFTMGTVLRINLGALALIATFIIGTVLLGKPPADLLALFPVDLFVILVGTTMLLGVAQANGTVDWIVGLCVRAVRGRVAFLPWILFLISALMSTMGPGAVPLLAGIGAKFITRYTLNPVLIGLMVVHGAQAGAFSPITPYGVVVNGMMERFGLTPEPWVLYVCVMAFNTLASIIGFRAFGGRGILGRKDDLDAAFGEASVESTSPVAGSSGLKVDATGRISGGGAGVHQGAGGESGGDAVATQATASIATELKPGRSRIQRPSFHQIATLIALIVFVTVVTAFNTDLGFTSLIIAVALLLVHSGEIRGRSVGFVAWPTLLLVAGVLTYVGLMQEMGTVAIIAEGVGAVGSPVLAILICCYIAAAVSSVASSLGIIGILIPLVLPFLQSGDVSVIGTIVAVAICATIVDVSPFSTYGAMVLANSHGVDVKVYERKLLGYTGVLILLAPAATWAVFVLPHWLP
ncbi:SLC13 family permease [Microbacterium sp. JZ101]